MITYRCIVRQLGFANKYKYFTKRNTPLAFPKVNLETKTMSTNSQSPHLTEKVPANKTMNPNNLPDWTRLVWVDCEMTGLDTKVDTLLEVAVLITDGDLEIVAEGPNIVIHHPEEVLTSMNEWCIQHHAKSGLTQMVRDSTIR